MQRKGRLQLALLVLAAAVISAASQGFDPIQAAEDITAAAGSDSPVPELTAATAKVFEILLPAGVNGAMAQYASQRIYVKADINAPVVVLLQTAIQDVFNLVNTWKAASIKDDAKLAALIKTVGSKEKVFSGAAGGNAANYQQSLIFLSTWCTVHLTLIQELVSRTTGAAQVAALKSWDAEAAKCVKYMETQRLAALPGFQPPAPGNGDFVERDRGLFDYSLGRLMALSLSWPALTPTNATAQVVLKQQQTFSNSARWYGEFAGDQHIDFAPNPETAAKAPALMQVKIGNIHDRCARFVADVFKFADPTLPAFQNGRPLAARDSWQHQVLGNLDLDPVIRVYGKANGCPRQFFVESKSGRRAGVDYDMDDFWDERPPGQLDSKLYPARLFGFRQFATDVQLRAIRVEWEARYLVPALASGNFPKTLVVPYTDRTIVDYFSAIDRL